MAFKLLKFVRLLSIGNRPYVCSLKPNRGLTYLLEKSADSKVKKMTFPMNHPAVWPTELHVEPHETFSLVKCKV